MHRIEETVERGICIGCGACSVASGGAVQVTLGPMKMYRADLGSAAESAVRRASRVCPFSDESPNEDELGVPRAEDAIQGNEFLGQFIRTFGGRVSDDEYILGSSSGGLTSWLLSKLLESGKADAVVSVGRSPAGNDALFEYLVVEPNRVQDQRKSNYYAASMAEVLTLVAGTDLRYIIVGVPCFIRAARALCLEDANLRERLSFFVSLVCGHYKTQAFAESLAWQLGIAPDNLGAVDFRVKRLDRTANDYDFAARDATSGEWVSTPVRDLVGGNWGHSAFQPEACNFCDDVVGETADVSFGDAWLPQFAADPRGTNVVVSRNHIIDRIFDEGSASGEVILLEVSPRDVVESQAGGFRHRRAGLSVRLADDLGAGLSVPKKRVAPELASTVSTRRKALIRQRRRMAAASHLAFADAVRTRDLSVYIRAELAQIALYRRTEITPWRRVVFMCKRVGRQLLTLTSRLRSCWIR